MIVSHKHKFIYLATSKTGTTSTYSQFSQYDEGGFQKHSTLNVLDFDLSGYFIFCFVRNPWERLLSGYLQSQKPINLGDSYRKYIYELSNSHSLPDFLKLADDRFWHDYDQSRYYLHKGKFIDFVGRFENLSPDLRIICNKLNIAYKELPHLNKTQHKHYSDYYDEESSRIVAEKYAKDIEYFGYKFGE